MRWAPRVVILDVFMPRLGGLEVSGVPNALELVAEAGLTVAAAFTKPVNLDRPIRP